MLDYIKNQIEDATQSYANDFDLDAIASEIVDKGYSDIDQMDYDEFWSLVEKYQY